MNPEQNISKEQMHLRLHMERTQMQSQQALKQDSSYATNIGATFGGKFFRGHISLKMGPFAPFLATIQALSRTRVFLLSENERKLLCMGRTFTVARTDLLHNCPFQLSFSWVANPARVKASEEVQNVTCAGVILV
jgi:hypothetical protein